jgi:hypothetical protein
MLLAYFACARSPLRVSGVEINQRSGDERFLEGRGDPTDLPLPVVFVHLGDATESLAHRLDVLVRVERVGRHAFEEAADDEAREPEELDLMRVGIMIQSGQTVGAGGMTRGKRIYAYQIVPGFARKVRARTSATVRSAPTACPSRPW